MPLTLPSIEEIAAQHEKRPAAPGPEVPVQDPEKEERTPPIEEELKDITEELGGKAPVAPTEPAKKDPTASKFAALARREKSAREEALKIEQMRTDFQRQQEDFQRQMKEFEDKQHQVFSAKNPMDVLKAAGFSYADVTAAAVGSYEAPAPDPLDERINGAVSPVQKELAEIKAAKDELTRQMQELQAERAEIRRQAEVKDILQLAESKGYEYVAKMGEEGATLVQNVRDVYRDQYKKVLSYEEACDTIEAYYESYASRFAETNKVKSRFAAPEPKPAPRVKPQQSSEAKESPRTLTQSLHGGTHAKIDLDSLPRHEALEHLASKIRFTD